jgi:hypothetical protein
MIFESQFERVIGLQFFISLVSLPSLGNNVITDSRSHPEKTKVNTNKIPKQSFHYFLKLDILWIPKIQTLKKSPDIFLFYDCFKILNFFAKFVKNDLPIRKKKNI